MPTLADRMSRGCELEPEVNNARASLEADNDTVTVTYQCLAGFYMTGTARLVCNRTLDIWAPPPTCQVIKQSTNLYNYNNIPSVDGWLYYLMVGLLALLAVVLLGGLIWCCCCASIVHPRAIHTDSNCCRSHFCWSRRQTRIGLDTTKNLPENRHASNHVLAAGNRACESRGQLTAHALNKEAAVGRNARQVKDTIRDKKIWLPHTRVIKDKDTTTTR